MKWPGDASIEPDVRNKLETRLGQFLTDDPEPDGANNAQAVQDLILDLYDIYTSQARDNDLELRQFLLILGGMEWDTEDPQYVHAQKYINRLFSSRTSEAYTYLDKAIKERAAEDSKVVKDALIQLGVRGGEAKNQNSNAAIARALDYYKHHHAAFKNKKEAARYCEKNFPPVKFSTYYRLLRKA